MKAHNAYRVKKKTAGVLLSVFRFVLIFGLCYIILYPFIIKILAACMSPEDLLDSTVKYVPRNLSTYYWKYAWDRLDLTDSGWRTLRISLISAFIQMLVSAMVGYGLARFKFPGRKLAFALVIIILLVPQQIYSIPQYMHFRYFGIGGATVNLLNTDLPFYLLAFGCMSVKQCLYIYLMRELFKDLPMDLENAAYVDGASIGRTFVQIVLPNAKGMMLTVFLFAFCWSWTDTELSSLYFQGKTTLALRPVLGSYIMIKGQVVSRDPLGTAIARNAAALIIIMPIVILAIICQRFLVRSISRTGMAN